MVGIRINRIVIIKNVRAAAMIKAAIVAEPFSPKPTKEQSPPLDSLLAKSNSRWQDVSRLDGGVIMPIISTMLFFAAFYVAAGI